MGRFGGGRSPARLGRGKSLHMHKQLLSRGESQLGKDPATAAARERLNQELM